MIGANQTWALVVGIDVYDDPGIRSLNAAASDALHFVQWLIKEKVPPKQILFHAAPTVTTEQTIKAAGLSFLDAKLDSITKTVSTTLSVQKGQRLIVFLSGHGLYQPRQGRMFLLQDFSNKRPINLGLDWYIKHFLSLDFTDQFLCMDGCMNYAFADGQAPTVDAMGISGLPAPIPMPGNRLASLIAAKPGQLAMETPIGDAGVMTKHLLKAIDLQQPECLHNVVYDFVSGRGMIDFAKVFNQVLASVTKETSDQTPVFNDGESDGWGWTPGNPVVFFEFDFPQPPLHLEVDVAPKDVLADLGRLKITESVSPYREVVLPQVAPGIGLPWKNLVPRDSRWKVTSDLIATSTWVSLGEPQEIIVQKSEAVTLRFRQKKPAPSGEVFVRVVSRDANGQPVGNMGFNLYQKLEKRLGTGVRFTKFEHHETGPQFVSKLKHLTKTTVLAEKWAFGMIELDEPVVHQISWYSESSEQTVDDRASLTLIPPMGGMSRLVGPITSNVFLEIKPNSKVDITSESRSLQLTEVTRNKQFLAPGVWRLRIELPWGFWENTVSLSKGEHVLLRLPDQVGHAPLRVLFQDQLGRLGIKDNFRQHNPGIKPAEPSEEEAARFEVSTVLVQSEVRPRMLPTLPEFLLEDSLETTSQNKDFFDRHAKNLSRKQSFGMMPMTRHLRKGLAGQMWEFQRQVRPPLHTAAIALLDARQLLAFPLPHNRSSGMFFPMAVEIKDHQVRVEPLSDLDLSAWDLLISTSQLDQLDMAAIYALLDSKWEQPLLGLAGAYALHANLGSKDILDWTQPYGEYPSLKKVTSNLERAGLWSVLDVDLLTQFVALNQPEALDQNEQGQFENDSFWLLRNHALGLEVPFFRWGIGLAIKLIEQRRSHSRRKAIDDQDFDRWQTYLMGVNSALVSSSAWTVWNPAAMHKEVGDGKKYEVSSSSKEAVPHAVVEVSDLASEAGLNES
jgi:Caspase domain